MITDPIERQVLTDCFLSYPKGICGDFWGCTEAFSGERNKWTKTPNSIGVSDLFEGG